MEASRQTSELILDSNVENLRTIVLREQLIGEVRGLRRLEHEVSQLIEELQEKVKENEHGKPEQPGVDGPVAEWPV